MNASDKLQLIRALEEREASQRRRSDVRAWGSVVIAAIVLGVMILAGRRELRVIEGRVSAAQEELRTANMNLEIVKAMTDEALRNLQNADGRAGTASAIESAVDNLLLASSSAAPPPVTGVAVTPPVAGVVDPDRTLLIQQLFDPSAAVRVKAYGGLLPKYKDDSTLVPEVLEVARENPQNANGIYNALVVLSHMNASSLAPYSEEIRAFAESSQTIGPRVSERARTLIGRLPK